MGVTIGSSAGYLIAFGLCRKDFIKYQLFILTVFLAHLIYLGQLDYTLPIYILAAVLPYLPHVRVSGYFTIYLILFNGLYLLIGIVAQNATASLTSYLARIFQFLAFYLFVECKQECRSSDLIKAIRAAVILETLFGIYLSLTGTSVQSSGLTRLVLNAQPIVGNISVAILPIIIWLYFSSYENEEIQTQLLFYSVVLLFWTILSGTRGYVLMFALPMTLLYRDYFFNTNGRKYETVRKRLVFFIIFATIAITAVLFFNDILTGKIESLLRVNESLGVRSAENELCLTFFKNAPLYVKILGVGLGGRESDYSSYRAAVGSAMSGSWTYNRYINGTGSIFHNLFANVLCTQGVVGIINVMLIIIYIMKRIGLAYKNKKSLKHTLWLCAVGFFVMNLFRWSAACGIPEMIMLACTINLQIAGMEIAGEGAIQPSQIKRKEPIFCQS